MFDFFLICFLPLLTTSQQNVFWKIGHSDPHAALSFDRLHTFPGGIFHHHLWPRLQSYIESLGREAGVVINATCVPLFVFFQGVIHGR